MNQQLIISCLMTLGLSSRLYAQEVAYIHCKEDCYAVDIQNNREFTVNKDTLDMGIGIVYNQADVDSITFTNPAVYTVRVGWWGDDRNGALNCYYESVNANMPDVSLSVFDGYCHDVMFPAADNDAAWQSRGIQKVGRKWRYVKNTLSGHHRIRIKAMEDNYNKGLATAMLKSMFYGKPTTPLQRAINFWYRPDLTLQMPETPVFGSLRYGVFTERAYYTNHECWYYEMTFDSGKDSLYCSVNFNASPEGMVNSDTIRFLFPTPEMAKESFEQTDTHPDDSISFWLDGRMIMISEIFVPVSLEEMKRRVTYFDLDLCRPLFIREEEE